MLKVDPKTNGSQHLSEGTEDIAPGASIPTHKHPTEDEVLLIHSGEAHVLLGEQERDLHAGGLVFIPANTWIGLKNISTEPLSVTFIFSAPGFEEIQRCISVPATKTPTQMTEDDLKRCEAPVSMEMASCLGVQAWDFNTHQLNASGADIDKLREMFDAAEVDAFLALRDAGFQFYFMPNG